MDLCAGETKVPVPCHCFGGRETCIAIVEGGNGETGVSSEDESSKRWGHASVHR